MAQFFKNKMVPFSPSDLINPAAPARLSRGCFTCLFPPLPEQYLGDFTTYSDSWLFIADWQVLVWGMKGRAQKVEIWSS